MLRLPDEALKNEKGACVYIHQDLWYSLCSVRKPGEFVRRAMSHSLSHHLKDGVDKFIIKFKKQNPNMRRNREDYFLICLERWNMTDLTTRGIILCIIFFCEKLSEFYFHTSCGESMVKREEY